VKRLGRLFRTTAFKLAIGILLIFTVFAVAILVYVGFSAQRLLDEQVSITVGEEIKGLLGQYNAGGVIRLVRQIERRSQQPGSSLYLVTSAAGETLAGNIMSVESEGLLEAGTYELFYRVIEDGEPKPHRALVETVILPGGFRLMVGRDLAETDRFRAVIWRTGGWSILFVLGLAVTGGVFVARRVLTRIDQMTETTRLIMAGDFSGRLKVSGTDDELDRLAHSLNTMLERIQELMKGLKEVSDNIAHDLKTPLTRLRNSAEEALRTADSVDDLRLALDHVIEEADNLIKLFNALLMIARAEAGGAYDQGDRLDLSAIARDVAELYEPLAEEVGLTVQVQADTPIEIRGSRELLGQALANLIDNAIKYSAYTEGDDQGPARDIVVAVERKKDVVELSIADRGPGIAEADRGRVLDRFVRLETSRTRPGSGLGLSLAAAIARLHHGALKLEDNTPGLRVVFSLPVGEDA
jgi:signal transduction histidine kinase